MDDARFQIIDGVGYWFDTDGNVVASQAPGEGVIFANDPYPLPASRMTSTRAVMLAVGAGLAAFLLMKG